MRRALCVLALIGAAGCGKPAAPADPVLDLVRQGQAHLDAGNVMQAEVVLTRAVEVGPQDARAWAARAEMRTYRQDLRGARDDLSRAISLDPKHAGYYATRATLNRLLGDPAAAAADDRMASTLDPGKYGSPR